jgi:hypothetical protein
MLGAIAVVKRRVRRDAKGVLRVASEGIELFLGAFCITSIERANASWETLQTSAFNELAKPDYNKIVKVNSLTHVGVVVMSV